MASATAAPRAPAPAAPAAAPAADGSSVGSGAAAGAAKAARSGSSLTRPGSNSSLTRPASNASLPRPVSGREAAAVAHFFEHELTRYNLLKHGRWGRPHARHFWLENEGSETMLRWATLLHDRRKASKLAFSAVRAVQTGALTKVLRRSGRRSDTHLFVTLLFRTSKDKPRTLDIQAETQADRDRLAWAFDALLRTPEIAKSRGVNPLTAAAVAPAAAGAAAGAGAAGPAGAAGSPGRPGTPGKKSKRGSTVAGPGGALIGALTVPDGAGPAAAAGAGAGAGRGRPAARGGKKGRRLSTLTSATAPPGSTPFDGLEAKARCSVGMSASLPLEWASISRPGNSYDGRTKTNQDSVIVHDNYGGKPGHMFIGVMDGHGPNGHFVSQFIRDHLPKSWLSAGIDGPKVAEVMRRACVALNRQLHQSAIDCFVSGTTCIASYIRDDTVWTANIGDSRAVVGRLEGGKIKAKELSSDHKPDRPDEQARIEASGGEVFEDGVFRVYQAGMEIPGLAMARSFGDMCAERVGVVAEPEVSEYKFDKDDKFAIWASDGVWEFIESQECVELIWAKMNKDGLGQAGTQIVNISVDRWHEEEDLVVDDTTLVITVLNYGEGDE